MPGAGRGGGVGVTYYLSNPRCLRCYGLGVIEILTKCCGEMSASRRECGCDGYQLDGHELCHCAKEVRRVGA